MVAQFLPDCVKNRLPLRSKPAEDRLPEGRSAEVRAEVRLPKVRNPLSFAPRRVRPFEVWTNGGLFCPPSVPNIDALPEEFEMLWVGH